MGSILLAFAIDAWWDTRNERVENRDIRALLGKWPDWLEDILTNDLSRRSSADRNIAPYLPRRGWPAFDWMGCDAPPCVPTGPMPDAYLAMARDPELRAMLNLCRAAMRGAVQDHLARVPEADRSVRLIAAELRR